MFSFAEYYSNRERHRALQQYAADRRRVQDAPKKRQPALMAPAMQWLGSRLVAWGERLQTAYA